MVFEGKENSFFSSNVYPLSQGWDIIYLIPFNEPILWLGFFAKSPRIKDLTYFETFVDFGNFGYEFKIAKKISSFLGA